MLAELAATAVLAVVGPSLSERLIYDFPSGWLRGGLPAAALIAGDRRAMYGTTAFGGTGGCNDIYPGCGTVFTLSPKRGGFTQRVIYNFQGKGDGFRPSDIVRDGNGDIYGLAEIGSDRRPMLFRIAKSASGYSETTLFQFPDIQRPSGRLTVGSDGSLYGADISFSTKSQATYGMIFRFTRSAGGVTERVLYDFLTVPEGVSPRAPLLVDESGVVYGATAFGGTTNGTDCVERGCGTIFKLTPSARGYKLNTLYRFTGGADGFLPSALIRDAAGTLYGATSLGGRNTCPNGSCGTVFSFNVATRKHTVLYDFTSSGLWYPAGDPLTLDGTGALYGTTGQYGAGNQNGGVYKLGPTPAGYVESVAHVFAGSPNDGASPMGGLLLGPSGTALYGTTYWGGSGGIGTAFELTTL
jgi:uncharacterized repeat protein (TIGR03803 family)